MTELERTMVQRMRNRTDKPRHEGDFWSDTEKDKLKFLFDNGYGSQHCA